MAKSKEKPKRKNVAHGTKGKRGALRRTADRISGRRSRIDRALEEAEGRQTTNKQNP